MLFIKHGFAPYSSLTCWVQCDRCPNRTVSFSTPSACLEFAKTRAGGRFQIFSRARVRRKYQLKESVQLCGDCKLKLFAERKERERARVHNLFRRG